MADRGACICHSESVLSEATADGRQRCRGLPLGVGPECEPAADGRQRCLYLPLGVGPECEPEREVPGSVTWGRSLVLELTGTDSDGIYLHLSDRRK